MTPTPVPLDLSRRLRLPTACPSCASPTLQPMSDGDRVTLLCRSCHRCWDPAFGQMAQVDPYGCSGCAEQPICFEHAATGTAGR